MILSRSLRFMASVQNLDTSIIAEGGKETDAKTLRIREKNSLVSLEYEG